MQLPVGYCRAGTFSTAADIFNGNDKEAALVVIPFVADSLAPVGMVDLTCFHDVHLAVSNQRGAVVRVAAGGLHWRPLTEGCGFRISHVDAPEDRFLGLVHVAKLRGQMPSFNRTLRLSGLGDSGELWRIFHQKLAYL